MTARAIETADDVDRRWADWQHRGRTRDLVTRRRMRRIVWILAAAVVVAIWSQW